VALHAIFNVSKEGRGSDRTKGESAFTDHSEGIACRRHEGGQRVVDIVDWSGKSEGGYLRNIED
jgi:hypothetical protein